MKRLLACILVVVMGFGLCACAANPAATETATTEAAETATQAPVEEAVVEPIVLKIAISEAATDTKAEAMKEFMDAVETRTNGAVTFELYANNELGSMADVLEQVAMGGNIILSSSVDILSDYGCPDWTAPTIFYALPTADDVVKFQESDLYQSMCEKIEANGIKMLCMNFVGTPRQLLSTKPVTTYADLSNLKVRVPTATFGAFFEAAGASTVSTAWSEVYTSLSTGVIDAAEAPLGTLYNSSLYEVAKYCTLTSHCLSPAAMIMSEAIFESLGEEYGAILVEEAKNAGVWYTDACAAAGDDFKAKLEEAGVTFYEFSDEDMQKMKDTAAVVYDSFPEMSPDIREQIQSAIAG